jgi:NhaP-type Na+/H+ or K+/H+ antiporter
VRRHAAGQEEETLDFPDIVLVFGLLLLVTSALSGWLHGTVLSISVLSLAVGAGLSIWGVVDITPTSAGLVEIIELALVLTLFSDGLTVERELLRERWRDPTRALVVAMPVTLVLVALAGKGLFPELTWPEALLLGAILAPTDPVVTSSVVSSPRVPATVRHALNLESGLNDGLALPFVLVFIVVAAPGGDAGTSALATAGESVAGAAIGAALAFAAGRALPRLPGGGLHERYDGVYALSVALIAYGLAEATIGNGLVATFVAGIAMAATGQELPRAFTRFNENLSAILQIAAFALFGALVVATDSPGTPWSVLAFILVLVLVARPAAIALAFARSPMRRPEKLFIAWFGPKGVASMLFALFALESHAPDRTIVFEIASFAILASILAHGLTDTVGARWVERRLAAPPGG